MVHVASPNFAGVSNNDDEVSNDDDEAESWWGNCRTSFKKSSE